jgi:hypothetical protein
VFYSPITPIPNTSHGDSKKTQILGGRFGRGLEAAIV